MSKDHSVSMLSCGAGLEDWGPAVERNKVMWPLNARARAVMEVASMKVLGITSTAILCLLLGIAAPALPFP